MLVALPLCAGLCSLAIPFIAVLYPSDYSEAATVLAWLAVLGAARVYLDFAYDLLSGTGRTLPLFLLQALWVVLLLPALVIGANVRGVGGVAAAHVIVAFVVMVPAYTFVISRHGPSARSVLLHLARPLGAAILAGVVATAVTRQTSPAFVAFLSGGFALVAVYGLLAARRSELWSLPKRLLRFEAAPA